MLLKFDPFFAFSGSTPRVLLSVREDVILLCSRFARVSSNKFIYSLAPFFPFR